jgi:protein O-GlcNAc transferase
MEIKNITGWVVLGLLPVIGVNAGTATSNGNQSPAIHGNHATVNYGTSKADIEKIVLIVLAAQSKANAKPIDTEQIKPITAAVTDLSQKGERGSAAIDALKQGNTTQAKELFAKEAKRGEKGAAEAYRNLGALAFLDNTQEALTAYRRATELDADNAAGWNRLGLLLKRIGELDEAIIAYQTVLKLGQSHQDQQEIAMAYGNLGTVYQTRGDLDQASEMYQKALQIDEALGNRQGMAEDYGNLGNVYKTRGDLDKASEMHQKALQIDEALGNRQGMAEDYGNLGNVYKTRGDLDNASEMYQKALQINEALGNKEIMAATYGNLGLVYEKQGNISEAKRHWQKSLELYQYLQSPNAKKVQSWLNALP